MVSALAPIGWFVLWRLWPVRRPPPPERTELLLALLAGIVSFVATSALVILPFVGSFAALWQGVVTFHTDAETLYNATGASAGNGPRLQALLLGSLAAGAAACGAIAALLRRDWRVAPLPAWLVATLYLRRG